MAIHLRSDSEIDALARAGRACWAALDRIASACVPGCITRDLDAIARDEIKRAGASPLFLGHKGPDGRPPFPGHLCVSINNELVHGIPGERLLRPGDVVSVDLGLTLDGWCADAARTVLIDPVPDHHRELHARTLEILKLAITMMEPGIAWSTIVQAVAKAVGETDTRLVEPYAGHGIGRALHEPPRAPLLNAGSPLSPNEDFILRPGMVLTVEPILVRGNAKTITGSDGWTVLAAVNAVGCHEERMVAIVRGGYRMLTGAPI
ncbi:MAG: type I methionyl aminopeptidase [Phycisphaeraceae bacterium]|nr:type I methionyl aminopeptidase [Phycisphaeraceae bacterium]